MFFPFRDHCLTQDFQLTQPTSIVSTADWLERDIWLCDVPEIWLCDVQTNSQDCISTYMPTKKTHAWKFFVTFLGWLSDSVNV